MNQAGRTKVALIGAGGWGRQHARVFAGRQDVDFCAVVGRTQEKTTARGPKSSAQAITWISRRCWTESVPTS